MCPVSSSNIYFQRKKELPHLYTCLHPINLVLPAQSFNCLERERKASYCWGSELLWHSCKLNFSLQKVLQHAKKHELSPPVLISGVPLWSHMFSFSEYLLLFLGTWPFSFNLIWTKQTVTTGYNYCQFEPFRNSHFQFSPYPHILTLKCSTSYLSIAKVHFFIQYKITLLKAAIFSALIIRGTLVKEISS